LCAVLLLTIVLLAWVLVRRERRRRGAGMTSDAMRVEAAATARWREGRRRARMGRDMRAVSTTPYLEQRDR
ncbi:hypothetical protein, partial [Streptomyces abyssalis]